MFLSFGFLPLFADELERVRLAQRFRGGGLEGGFGRKLRGVRLLLVPLFVSAFRRADELAFAMESRCYNGGEGRTRMKVLRFHYRDFISAAVVAGLIVFLAFGY